MRLVVAVVAPAQVESVRRALAAVEVTRLSICDAHGYDLAASGALAQEAVLEIAVNDDFLARTVDTIAAVLAAGGGTGRVHVLPVEETVQLYRSVRGPEAV